MESKGLELTARYQAAQPFPHIVIDDFLPPEVLETCLAKFPVERDPESETFDRPQERRKTSFNPDYLDPQIRSIFYSFNSRPFIRFLENLTGIGSLIPDPYFSGGGFHEIRTGGHLSMHADFNHHKELDLERRINALIYLNKDWRPEYGGQLELWNNEMTECVESVVPEFNRLVVFSTTSHSNHGNPNPIAHPDGLPRRSIALYYYTSTWTDERKEHTTHFRVRPGSDDKVDLSVKRSELLKDWLPPVAQRGMSRAKRLVTERRR
jgi:hypothetical protein